MSSLRYHTRATTVLLAFACLAYAAGSTGDEALLRYGAALSRSAALGRCAAMRPAYGLRMSIESEGTRLSSIRGGSGAEASLRAHML